MNSSADAAKPGSSAANHTGQPARKPNPATVAFRKLGEAAKQQGLQDEFAGIVQMIRDSRGRPPSIVVVGEVNRGKSTLVNSLLATANLAPTGPSAVTALAVNYEVASDDFPLGEAELEFPQPPNRRRIPAAELPAWIRLDSPVLMNADPAPLQASQAVRPGFLQGCTIVDTPGSGGLSEAYALRALARARDASVLLLVTDAAGRITEPALDFLMNCAEHVESVVVAVTKLDLYRNSSAQILEENRQILAARSPRLANIPMVAVSGAWGERAAAEADPERRRRLFEASRVPELADALRAPLVRANQLPTLNALRQGAALLEQPLVALQAEREALGGAVEAPEDAVRIKEHRENLLRTFEDSRYDWGAQVDRVRVELTSANSRLTREFAAHWRERVQSKGSGISDQQALVLRNELAADLEVNVRRALAGIAQRAGALLGELYADAGMDPHRALFGELNRRITEVGDQPRAPIEHNAASLDPRTLFSGALMGSGIGSLTLGALLGPVGAALVGMSIMGSLGALLARRQAKRQSFLQTVNDATVELREVLDRAVRGVLQVVQTDAKKIFDRDLKASANAAKAELDRIESARRASESERKQRLGRLNPQIEQIQDAMRTAAAEVERLTQSKTEP